MAKYLLRLSDDAKNDIEKLSKAWGITQKEVLEKALHSFMRSGEVVKTLREYDKYLAYIKPEWANGKEK